MWPIRLQTEISRWLHLLMAPSRQVSLRNGTKNIKTKALQAQVAWFYLSVSSPKRDGYGIVFTQETDHGRICLFHKKLQ